MSQLFQYAVRNYQGKRITGILEAQSPEELIRELDSHGYIVTEIRPAKTERLFQRRWDLKGLATFCQQLSTVIRVGIPIVEGLGKIQQQMADPQMEKIVHRIREDISNGKSLTLAFEKQGSFFPPLLVKMLQAGEMGGNVDHIFQLLAEKYRRDYEVQKKLKSAITYPAIVFIFSLILIMALTMFALPAFTQMFERSQTELPLLTRIVLSIREGIISHGLIIITLLIIAGFAGLQWHSSEKGRRQLDWMTLHLPFISGYIQKLMTYRFSQTLRDLYASGIPIQDALHMVSQAIDHAIIGQAVKEAAIEVGKGKGITQALTNTGMFGGFLLSMVHIGEETGDMEGMLEEVAQYTRAELEQSINQALSLIEPVLIILVGVVVGGIILSILLPMYDGMMMVNR